MPLYNGSNTAAGVYGGEEDNSFSPQALYPSTGAIVGPSNRGPVGVPTVVSSKTTFRKTFGRRNAQLTFAHFAAERFLTKANKLWFLRVDTEANYGSFSVRTIDGFATVRPANRGYLNPAEEHNQILEEILLFYGADPGTWNNDVRVLLYPDVNDMDNELFVVEVFEGNYSVPVETYRATLRDKMVNGAQMNIEYQLEASLSRIRAKINDNNPQIMVAGGATRLINTVIAADLTFGDNGRAVEDIDILNGWEEFENPDDYDIRVLINCGYTNVSIQQKMLSIAETRRDCFAILDIPSNMQTAAQAVNYRRNILNVNTSFGALYCSDILELTDEGQEIYVPCSGAVGAVFAQSDEMEEEWFAAAGVIRGVIGNVNGIRHKYDLGQRNMLDQNQVNFIHKFSGYGYCVWGAQTLQSDKSALQDIPVRRLINHIETTAKYDVLRGVYEPNDEFLWQDLKNTVDAILRPIMNKRGLYYYEVKCDAETNPAEQIANGDVVLIYIIEPTRYSKRILFTTTVAATGQLSTAVNYVTQTAD